MSDPLDRAAAEIERLHEVIAAWIRGDHPQKRFDTDFLDAIHPDFEYVQPDGTASTGRGFADGLRAAHGANPAFRISIEAPRLLGVWDGLILAGYVEHQSGAKMTHPENRRGASVLFEDGDRLRWRFLQETGLPEE